MKILILNTSDIQGGAARAAYRLHKSLLDAGIDSRMLVQSKSSDDYTIIGPETKFQKAIGKILPIIDQIPVRFYKNRIKILFSPAWMGNKRILKIIDEIDPDIVHLHWICGGMIKIEDLPRIKKPIVWTLHDMWPFTGGCHINWGCKNYKGKCGNCKVLSSNKRYDLSKWIWNRKQKIYGKINNLTIVGLSKWITDRSQESNLLKSKRHINLPNPIDIDIFKPLDKNWARELWNLPKNKKLILFGAMSAMSDINKGFSELSKSLDMLRNENIEFVVFGSSKPKNPPKFKFRTHYIGRVYDDISLVSLYNAADVMVVPSLQENLSNVIMESLSCGTPVVGFGIGGNPDMIAHKKNGYLAKPFDPKDLASGIEWVLNNKNYDELCKNAREKVVRDFDSKVVAKKYIELYEEVLGDG